MNALSEPKFTPGPWTAEPRQTRDDNGHYLTYEVADAQGRCVVEFSNTSVSELNYDGESQWDEQSRANAHLISAAPELYAALESALEQFELLAKEPATNPWCVQMRAALSKARGDKPPAHPKQEDAP